MYAATASTENMTWPYVDLPMFEIHGQHAREQSGVEVFAFAPLVEESERAQWLEYSWDNQGWIDKSREILASQRGEYVLDDYVNASISTELYRGSATSNDQGPHFPIWQFSPPPFNAKFINWNLKDAPWMEQMLPALSASKGALFVIQPRYCRARLGLHLTCLLSLVPSYCSRSLYQRV